MHTMHATHRGGPTEPTTFGLVHGSWHGAWCWDLLAPELEALGFRCVAVDLPTEDASCGATASAGIVAGSLAAVTGRVALVGHSLGGLTIPVVAQLRPVQLLVFLAAFLPVPGRSMLQQVRESSPFTPAWPDLAARQIGHPDGSSEWPPEAAIEAFYHDCPPDRARWAASRLRRQTWKPFDEPSPLTAWPDVESVSILCRDDRVVSPDWSRGISEQRLGRPAVEIDGGHSPFLARPAPFAGLLADLAST